MLSAPFGGEGEGDCVVLLAGDMSTEDWCWPETDPEDGGLPEEGAFS